jgi:xanthine dehydrogenase accessory factor
MFEDTLIAIKGAGDLATGVAIRLFRCGFAVVMTETAAPTAIRRTVAFAEAVYAGDATVEEVRAVCVAGAEQASALLAQRLVPILVDPSARIVSELHPAVIVDAIIAKRNCGTSMADAPFVIGLGPGFTAGVDVHAVIETNRGHHLGRVILDGSAEPNTGRPGTISGTSWQRVLRAPATGTLVPYRGIGDPVRVGDLIATVAGQAVAAPLSGVLRGLIHERAPVHEGMKIGDVDPRGEREYCFTVSDKSLAIAGGVLEAVLMRMRMQRSGSRNTARGSSRGLRTQSPSG